MSNDIHHLCENLKRRAAQYSIIVRHDDLDNELAGEFDGPTITLNDNYDPVERAFYLTHSIGSIAEWSTRFKQSQQVFRALRRVKCASESAAADFKRALSAYLAFENRAWELAAWLLADTGHENLLDVFTNFGRADMEAMRVFHTTGEAPIWRDFFAAWNEEVRQGRRKIEPFVPRPIPEFRATPIPKQEILQEGN